ncbi:MAG: hypothetical protein ACI8XB_000113 [Patiriisocius sp.]|jgi:hypothetical protein
MKIFLLIFFLMPCMLFSQFSDNFSDGDFTANPTWEGEVDHFEIDDFSRLHLIAPSETSSSFLSTASEAINDASWEFTVEFDFNPTSSNMSQVYLVANSVDLEADLQGYFVRVGNTTKEVSLYRQDAFGDVDEIIDGADDILDLDPVNCRIKVTRSATGDWELMRDVLGGEDYISEGTVTDITYETSSYFGVFCKYTSTRSDKFFYSNFVVTGEGFVDIEPPTLLSQGVLSQSELALTFSEAMDQVSIGMLTNYDVNNSVGIPMSINLVNPQSVILTFNNNFIDGQTNTLSISGLMDLAGNELITVTDFTYHNIGIPSVGDIVINELMVDPSPSINLPDVEYLELFNASNFSFDMGELALYNSSVLQELSGILPAGGYVIITDDEDENLFTNYGATVGVSTFTALANTADSITLTTSMGEIIDIVSYTDDWYQSASQSDGGYSLERVNPFTICSGMQNWSASSADDGGTPGIQNSIFDGSPDINPPGIVGVSIGNSQTLILVFDESLLFEDVNDAQFIIDNDLIITNIGFESGNEVVLSLNANLQTSTQYTVAINELQDCSGNVLLVNNSISFAIPGAGDIIVNEIMADPTPLVNLPDVEYLEIYNAGDVPFDLSLLEFYNSSDLRTLHGILPAGDYLIITDVIFENLLSTYGPTIGLESFVPLSNSMDSITLVSALGDIVDIVSYTDDWFQSAIHSEGGYSLERVNPFMDCSGASNWMASSAIFGGTPGEQNSIYDDSPDLISPNLLEIFVDSDQSLILVFDKPLLQVDIDAAEFIVDNGISVVNAELLSNNEVILTLKSNLLVNTLYLVTVTELQDCSGNILMENNSITFGLPEQIQPGDIVINEILSNPRPEGFDFIEIYNVTDKYLTLRNCKLTRLVGEEFDVLDIVTNNNKLLSPGDYIVLTEDPANILYEYPDAVESKIFGISKLPGLNDDLGDIIFVNAVNQVIDAVGYSDSFHFELLDDTEGVSLERLNFNDPSNDPENWHSASQIVGYATPGYENSQNFEFGEQEQNYTIQPRVISPDNDGFEDIMAIHYVMESPDFVANISILDAQGRLVKYLTKNQLLGVEGTIYWDGLLEEEMKAPIGLYVIYLEFYDLEGNVEMFKEVVTVAGNI